MGTPRIRASRRRLIIGLAAAFTAGTGALAATPLHAFAAQTVTLTASSSTAAAGTPITLTATASPTPALDYSIEIDETTRSDFVTSCSDQSPCSGTATYPRAFTGTFQATLTTNTGAQIKSNTVTASWTGSAPYTVTLSSSASSEPSGQPVTLTAVASPGVPTGYFLDIYENETGTLVATCYESTPCSGDASHDTGTYTYTAYLDNDPVDEDPPSGTVATSNTVGVTWILPPSQRLCPSPTIIPLTASVESASVYMALQAGVPETDVCFRVQAGSAVGGAVVIKTTALPNVFGGNLCNGATGNSLPGSHPVLTAEGVTLDVYSGPASGGAVWVCVSDGSVGETVSVTGALVSFQPDPDSIVQ
jgi:hypothetical protein